MKTRPALPADADTAIHGPALATALALMVAATVDPRLLADAAGHADHALAMAVFWAMSAGFVRGVGFVPRLTGIRWLLSGWACLIALLLAALLSFRH